MPNIFPLAIKDVNKLRKLEVKLKISTFKVEKLCVMEYQRRAMFSLISL